MSKTIVTRKITHMCDKAGRLALGGYTGYVKDLSKEDQSFYWAAYYTMRRELTNGRTYYTAAAFFPA